MCFCWSIVESRFLTQALPGDIFPDDIKDRSGMRRGLNSLDIDSIELFYVMENLVHLCLISHCLLIRERNTGKMGDVTNFHQKRVRGYRLR